MIKYKVFILAVLLFSVHLLKAQIAGGAPGQGVDMSTVPFGFVTEIKALKDKSPLHNYLKEGFEEGNIYLKGTDQYFKNVFFRYETLGEYLELNTKEGQKGLPLNRVDSFAWVNPIDGSVTMFLNGVETEDLNKPRYEGLFKQLTSGEFKLLEEYTYTIKEPNYNAALDSGSKEYKVSEKSQLYLYHVPTHQLIEIPRSRKKLAKEINLHFPDHQVGKFVKENKVSGSDIEGLKLLVSFLNEKS